jgi:hypothetical protein
MVQRTVDTPAARTLIDVALQAHHTVGALVVLGIAPARGKFDLPHADRAAVGVEMLERLLRGAAAHRVARFLDRSLHLQQRPAQIHRDLDRHLRPSPSNHRRNVTTFSHFI